VLERAVDGDAGGAQATREGVEAAGRGREREVDVRAALVAEFLAPGRPEAGRALRPAASQMRSPSRDSSARPKHST
jgi:hypothetical protein